MSDNKKQKETKTRDGALHHQSGKILIIHEAGKTHATDRKAGEKKTVEFCKRENDPFLSNIYDGSFDRLEHVLQDPTMIRDPRIDS